MISHRYGFASLWQRCHSKCLSEYKTTLNDFYEVHKFSSAIIVVHSLRLLYVSYILLEIVRLSLSLSGTIDAIAIWMMIANTVSYSYQNVL